MLSNPISHVPGRTGALVGFIHLQPRWPFPTTAGSAAFPCALCVVLCPEVCVPALAWALQTATYRAQSLVLPLKQSPNFLAPLLSPKPDPLPPNTT